MITPDTFVHAVIRNFEILTGLSDTKVTDSLFEAAFAKELKESIEKVREQLFNKREEEIKRITSGDRKG